MSIVIQVDEKIALELYRYFQHTDDNQTPSFLTQQLLAFTTEHQTTLIPMYPGQFHPLLVVYFLIETTQPTDDDQLIAILLTMPQVKAAYKKANAELPN